MYNYGKYNYWVEGTVLQQYFWDKPIWKKSITLGVPFVLTFINEIVGAWILDNGKFNLYKLIVIVLCTCYLLMEVRYFKQEKENKTSIDGLKAEKIDLESDKRCYEQTITSLITIFADSANSISNITYTMESSKTLNKAEWNFNRVATGICDKLYEIICDRNAEYSDFSVNIMLYDTKAKGKNRYIKMIAHKSMYPTKPTIFLEKLYLNKRRDFFAVKLFDKNKQDIQIMDTPNEVNQRFTFKDNEHPNYNQYVGIPIHCNGNQMVSLLQICAFNKSKIGDSKNDIMEFVLKCVIPFTHFALLAYNIEANMDGTVDVLTKGEVS